METTYLYVGYISRNTTAGEIALGRDLVTKMVDVSEDVISQTARQNSIKRLAKDKSSKPRPIQFPNRSSKA